MIRRAIGMTAYQIQPFFEIRSHGMANHLKYGQNLQRLKSSVHKPWKSAYDNFPRTLLRPKWHVIDVRWNDGVGISKSELVRNSKHRQKLMLALGMSPC